VVQCIQFLDAWGYVLIALPRKAGMDTGDTAQRAPARDADAGLSQPVFSGGVAALWVLRLRRTENAMRSMSRTMGTQTMPHMTV
jgi:hypothetical protein